MDVDLNTTDLGMDNLRSSDEDGNRNSSGEYGIDGRTASDSDDLLDSHDSDAEGIISYCRGINEHNSDEAVVEENNAVNAVVVENTSVADSPNDIAVNGQSDPGPCLEGNQGIADDEDPEKKELRLMCEAIEQRLSVGSILQDLEQTYLIYCEYGRLKGFRVRRGEQRYHTQSTEVKWKEYVCSCTGVGDPKASKRRVPAYKKVVVRTGCRAKIRVARKLGSPWQVSIFDREHNHGLVSAEQAYMLRSSRNLKYAQASILEALHAAGIGVSQACGFMEKQCGGPQNLGFTRRDAYDHFARKGRKSKLDNGDSQMLHDYFLRKSSEDPFFYWNVEKDDDGRLMNFFFRDGRSLADYEAFPEVLSVDTTYSTNKYNLICAPFVGINHHTFTCMFGIGFLSDETTSSFEWLFNEFLQSMNGRQPNVVFTDQCAAMMSGIDNKFPLSKHRLCQWHVNRNATKRFGSLNRNSEFKKLWHQCMNEVETEREFDEVWEKLLTFTNPVGKNQNWFKAMHKLRHRWAAVFTRGIFTAGLLSTSRSEGANRCVKSGIRRTHTLIQFVENYEELKIKWRRREMEEETLGLWLPGQMLSTNKLFTQAASTYTRKVYQMFEHEAIRIWDVELAHDHVDLGGGDVEISATMLTHGRGRNIVYNKHTNCARCSCRMWESEGILCRHILRVYHYMNNYSIPESQILKRWTKSAKAACLIKSVLSDNTGTLPNMLFVNTILRRVYDITCMCVERQECRSVVKERVEALGREIYDMTGLQELNKKCNTASHDGEKQNTAPFTDPKRILEKGFVNARGSRSLESLQNKAVRASKKGPLDNDNGKKQQAPITPHSSKVRARLPSSVPRIPFQMNEHTMPNRSLYEEHSAGLIPYQSKYRSLSQP